MRKKYFYAAAMAAMLASCSSNVFEGPEVAQSQKPAIDGEMPVGFSVYTSRSVTRSGYEGKLDGTQLMKSEENGGGFGVFGYYTDMQDYDLQLSKANFMYNQGVFYSNNQWTYTPVKYWPNEYGSDAQSQDIDKVSFFGYAPYVKVDPTTGKVSDLTTTGITAVSRNTNTGDPMVWYVSNFNLQKQVDLCWAVVGSNVDGSWPIIQDNGIQQLEAGFPWLNVQRPKGVSYDDQKMKFTFKHALAQLNIQIDADADLVQHDDDSDILDTDAESKPNTKIYVRSVTINGLANKGTLNLNNVVSNNPLWLSYTGKGNITAESTTIYDGRRDGKEGVDGAVATNEILTGLNSTIISDNGNASEGVTGTLKNLFEPYGDGDADAKLKQPLYVIPTGEPLSITIVYDVETKDANLSNVLSDNSTKGSSIENKITKEVVFGAEETLSAGNCYTLKMHLGLNSVKFDAAVSDWSTTDNVGETWLPSNVAKGVSLYSDSEYNTLMTSRAFGTNLTIYGKVEPEDVTNKSLIWTSSNDEIATVVDGVVTPLKYGNVTISCYNPGTGKTASISLLSTKLASAVTDADFADYSGFFIGSTTGLLYRTRAGLNNYGEVSNAILVSPGLGLQTTNWAATNWTTQFSTVEDPILASQANSAGAVNVGQGTWDLGTVQEWTKIFKNFGENGEATAISVSDFDDLADNAGTNRAVPWGNINSKLAALGCHPLRGNSWTKDEKDADNQYVLHETNFWAMPKTMNGAVRLVLRLN